MPDTDPSILDNTTAALRRSWHAVAVSDEVGAEPVQVWLLGDPWVLVRLRGELRAFPDRCPHRLAPLSAGWVDGDVLRCGYHGWCFDGGGACTSIPALGDAEHLPPRAKLQPAAGVAERYGLVWLAPDDPVGDLPRFPEWSAEGFERGGNEPRRTRVSAAQLIDNFLDASHFPYVHTATFGTDEAAEVVSERIERDGWVVRTTFDTWYRNLDDPLVATGAHPEVQPQRLLKEGTAGYSVYLRLGFPVTGATFSILFVCQPETATSTRIYKLFARDDLAGDPERMARTVKDEDTVLDEDLAVLERYHTMRLHLDQTEVHTRADRLSVAWRRVMAELVGT